MLAKTPRSRVDLAFVTSTPEMLLNLNTPAIISSAQSKGIGQCLIFWYSLHLQTTSTTRTRH